MKVRLTRMLLALLCMAAFMGSATAFDSEAFREKNADALETKGVFLYGTHEFREGLMPVLVKNTWNYKPFDDTNAPVPETIWNYINEKLEIVDLNKGRFVYVYPFFEGLAAVISDEGGVGYIDKTGKIVIPCQFGSISSMGDVYTGYFKNGVASVFEESYYTDYAFSGQGDAWMLGRIDKTGKLIQDYTMIEPGVQDLTLIADNGYMPDQVGPEKPETTLNKSSYTTTSFELYNPQGYFDAFSSEHRVHYKLENKTDGVDRVDIAVIPCVLGGNVDYDGSMGLSSDRYYPLPVALIQAALEPGETVRSYFNPQWGWDADMLKYVVIKLDPGDMDLLQENGIGAWDKDSTYHPTGRTDTRNQLASDFIYKHFADYLK